ncbi:MAG: EFR1 family ferrodoxin [Cellulosilyticaceae bacterium]
MKKAVIFYFSGTGNTYWVAQKIGAGLKERGYKVHVKSIEALEDKEADRLSLAADLVGFGYPVYCSDVPKPMQTVIQGLGCYQNKPCFIFCTQAGFSGDGARASMDFVAQKGFDVRWAIHFTMANNITADCSPLSYHYTPKSLDKLLIHADQKAQNLCDLIAANKPLLVGFCKGSKAAGNIQRIPYRRYAHKFRQMISFSPKCTHCGYCEKICPTHNITVTSLGNITYNQCIFCMRCYNFCPHTAIRIYGKDHNFKRGVPYRGPIKKFRIEKVLKS